MSKTIGQCGREAFVHVAHVILKFQYSVISKTAFFVLI